MSAKVRRCPNCGAPVALAEPSEVVTCLYCGTSITGVEAVRSRGGSNIQNLLNLAGEAERANNFPEAYEYYTRILEIDPLNSRAWFGKGLAASRMSALSDLRLANMVNSFENAIEHASPQERSAVRADASDNATRVAVWHYNSTVKWIKNLYELQRKDAWAVYLEICAEILAALESSYRWDPQNVVAIAYIIDICHSNIEGVEYQQVAGWPMMAFTRLSADYEQQMVRKLELYEGKMKELVPDYQKREIEKSSEKTEKSCFVATATLGSADNATVEFLGHFRDTWLAERRAGRALIAVYYFVGPCAANLIVKSALLRRLSLRLLVRPASYIAEQLLVRESRDLERSHARVRGSSDGSRT